ncbi:carbohydrate ABC transporter permease [Gynuella sp.]|uniref:carbohydrate ABC transporter permease n=1 Tax=Gynuella sp. TaxID=2969146 RepID=UPI003D10BFF2
MISRTQRDLIPTYVFLVIIAFLSIFPFFWMIVSITNTNSDIFSGSMSFGSNLINNFNSFNEQVNLGRVLWNTTKVAVMGTFLTLLVASLAGYGFEMFKSRVRERVYQVILLTMMIPFAALMIPLFTLFAKSGLLDTHIAVVLPTVAWVYIIFYFRQSSKAFPAELREAARVDGMNEWQIFFFIYIPIMRSTYAAAFIIVFMANWNNFLWPLIVLQSDEMKTMTLVISSLSSAYTPDYGAVMVGTVLATIPTLIVFFAMQRQFVQGMLGSIKQ